MKNKLNLSFDWRIVSVTTLIAIVISVFYVFGKPAYMNLKGLGRAKEKDTDPNQTRLDLPTPTPPDVPNTKKQAIKKAIQMRQEQLEYFNRADEWKKRKANPEVKLAMQQRLLKQADEQHRQANAYETALKNQVS